MIRRAVAILIFLSLSQIAAAQSVTSPDTTQGNKANKQSQAKLYQGIIETGYSWGLGEWGQSVYRFNFINGIRLPHFSAGIGTGLSKLISGSGDPEGVQAYYQVPFFLDNRVYFSNGRFQPYLAGGIGVSIANYKMVGSISLFFNSSAGIACRITHVASLAIGIAFESYQFEYDNDPKNYSNSLGVTVGLSF